MNTVELKTSLYKILDEIKDERLLLSLYDFLKIKEEKTGRLWSSLSEEQKKRSLFGL